jgi:hypothetical protein
MGLQRGWPDFLLIAPGGRLHALEIKRRGEAMTEEQEDFEVGVGTGRAVCLPG